MAGKTFTQPLTLKMDPRAAVTPLGLTQQFTLAKKVVEMMNRSFAAFSAIAAPNPQAPGPNPSADLAALNSDLATAYDVIEGAHRAPTAQAVKAVTHLEQRLKALLKGAP